MDKLILLSIIFATVFIPAFGARDPSPRHGLTRTLVWLAFYLVFYVFLLLFVAIDLIDTTRPESMYW